MKIKYKFGNNKIKIYVKGKIGTNYDGENSLEATFTKSDLKFLFKVYHKALPVMTDFYKGLNKQLSKQAKANAPGKIDFINNRDILQANGHDIYNYVARYGTANFQIQAVMMLHGRLDFEKLCRAVRLSVDAEPVLGSRFTENEPPYWRRLDNLDKIEFCSIEETENPASAVQRFLDSPLDMDNDPMVKIKLVRTAESDTMVVKVNHSCSDGAGVKEYIRLLSDIYTNLVNNGVYEPQPAARTRRDQNRLFAELGIADPDKFFIPGSDISIPTWFFPWEKGGSRDARYVICRLPEGQLDKISGYARAKGAKINDMILAAYYRAMLGMGQEVYDVPLEIPITVDLRRYLPDKKTEAIRNFSGSVNTWLQMKKDETFGDTLSRVSGMMNDIKKAYPGLQSAIGLERLEKISFHETMAYYQVAPQTPGVPPKTNSYSGDKCVPSLSNLGVISNDLLKFGKTTVKDAYIAPPVVRPPGILLMVSTYNGILTLAAGYYEGTILRENAEKLLEKIKEELMEGCNT